MDWVHYTNSIHAMNGIIKNGLLINPLERKLIQIFSTSEHFSEREPQQFGLTSLRKDNFLGSMKHIKQFGHFGIVFKAEWVKKENFKKVWYLKEGSTKHKKLKTFFDEAEKELIHCIKKHGSNDSFPDMAYTNKVIAGLLGAKKYSHFLSIYELLEPAKNSWQNEFRYVQSEPIYNQGTTREFIKKISKPGWSNILMTKKFNHSDVSHFVTQRKFVKTLKSSLPLEYQDKPVKWKAYI